MESRINSYTVQQLKNWLDSLGEKTTGNKNELISRIQKIPIEIRGDFPLKETRIGALASAISVNDDHNDEDSAEIFSDSQGELFEQERPKGKKNTSDLILMKRELKLLEKENFLQEKENSLLKRENELLRRENTTTSGGNMNGDVSNSKVHFGHIKDLLSEFSGTGDSFQLWESQLRSLQNSYQLDDNNMRALISSKIKGKALKWLHSKDDVMTVSIDELLADLRVLFQDRASRLTLRRQFESRRWLSSESFQEYYHEKVILANKICIDDEELLEHILEGIPDQSLQSQARMHRFKQTSDLLEAFQSLSLPKSSNTASQGLQREGATMARQLRCFNCNAIGHMANECRKQKREVGACHICGKMGHYAAGCPKRYSRQIHNITQHEEDDYIPAAP